MCITEDSYSLTTPCNTQAAIRDTQTREDPKSGGHRGAYQEEESKKGQEKLQKEDQSYFDEPTWESSVPEIPSVNVPSASNASAKDAEARAELKAELAEKKYKELLRKLKQTPDALTPDVQEIVTKETVQETQSSAKSLHSAVSKMERAQKALDAAQGARLQLHSRWRTFCDCGSPQMDKVGRGLSTKRQGSLRKNYKRKEDARICQRRVRAAERPIWASSRQARGRSHFRRRGQDGDGRCRSTCSPERQWYADESGEDQDHGRRAARGGAEGGQKTLCLAYTDGNWLAFCDAQQCRALGSGCQGHLYGPDDECISWAHSICSSRRFVSVWEASLRGLQAAMDLGNSLGEPTVHPSLRHANRTDMSVTFAESVQLVFYSTDTRVGGVIDMPEATFTTWKGKPWALEVDIDVKPSLFTSCAEPHDQTAMMQVSLPVHHRNEVDVPNWVEHVPERQLPAQHESESEEESDEEVYGEHQRQHVSPVLTPSSDSQLHPDLQAVILFRHFAATMHAQVRWTPIDDRLDDVAHILLLPRNQVVTLYELNYLPEDLSGHQVPCIVHCCADLPFGEPMKLTLIDIEIHANVHEENFQVSPALDRRVVILPETLHRQHLLLATFTDTYCRQVQDRCLVRHNGEPVPLQQQDLLQVEHGDYFLIVIPPDLWCEDPTRHLLEDAHEAELALQPQFQEEASDHEHISTKGSKNPIRMSRTEEFLRAVGAWSVAQTELPEFPLPGIQELQAQPQWIQDLMPVWRARANPGPAGMELLAKVDTWYSDHPRVQRCFHSRIVILSPDFTDWHAEIKRAWADVVLEDFEIHFAWVYPATVDIAPDVIAQILLIQRPDPYQRSIVVTVADTAVQRGLPISQAVVVEDRVNLHGVLLMIDLLYVCPPEHHLNRCHSWSEGREIQGDLFANAEHGDSFLLHVLRLKTFRDFLSFSTQMSRSKLD